jgi:tetratricopeptide (TPR) repeat protein
MLAYRALGDIALRQEKPQEAVAHYEKLLSFAQSNSEQVENGYLLALSYFQAGQKEKAVERLLMILRIKPDDKATMELLSRIRSTR